MRFGLNEFGLKSMVAVAMIDNSVKVCVHCRHDFRVRFSEDIGLYAHWRGDWYFVDVVLLFSGGLLGFTLFREAWVFHG